MLIEPTLSPLVARAAAQSGAPASNENEESVAQQIPSTTVPNPPPSAVPEPTASTEPKPPVVIPAASAVPKPTANAQQKPPVIAPGASVVPKPAASAHPPPRASSAYPTPSEAARSTSIGKERPASKGARSQSALAGRRRALLSAVPDSAVLAPIRRPDNGGAAGRTISVYTNHFRVTLDAVTINQYDVEIVFVGNDGKERSARKDERWEVMQRIAKEKKDFPLVW